MRSFGTMPNFDWAEEFNSQREVLILKYRSANNQREQKNQCFGEILTSVPVFNWKLQFDSINKQERFCLKQKALILN